MSRPDVRAPGALGVPTASWPHRMLALAVDWLASTLVVALVSGGGSWEGFVVLGVFVAESALFTALAAGSFGQLATRMRVLRTDGAPLPLLPALARQVLVALVIPPLVFKPDGRGLHDLAVGSTTARLADLRQPAG